MQEPPEPGWRGWKGIRVLISHHDCRICLLHSTHMVVRFWGNVSVLLDAREQQCVGNGTATGRKGPVSFCQTSNLGMALKKEFKKAKWLFNFFSEFSD